MGGDRTDGSKKGTLPPGDDRLPVAVDGRDGALIDSEALVRRLGGWQVMASLADPPVVAGDGGALPVASDIVPPVSTAQAASGAMPLRWTATAAAECERLHAIIGAVGEEAATRFAAATMRLIVRLTVDGIAAREAEVVEVALLPALALRIQVAGGALVVLGLRAPASVS